MHCGSRFFSALIHCPEGQKLMTTDRRLACFKDLFLEVDRIVRRAEQDRKILADGGVPSRGGAHDGKKGMGGLAAKMTSAAHFFRESVSDGLRASAAGGGGGGGGGPPPMLAGGAGGGGGGPAKDLDDDDALLGRVSVQERMSREYPTLLLHATATTAGLAFLAEVLAQASPAAKDAPLLLSLGALACYAELDYLTRLLAGALCFDLPGWTRKVRRGCFFFFFFFFS